MPRLAIDRFVKKRRRRIVCASTPIRKRTMTIMALATANRIVLVLISDDNSCNRCLSFFRCCTTTFCTKKSIPYYCQFDWFNRALRVGGVFLCVLAARVHWLNATKWRSGGRSRAEEGVEGGNADIGTIQRANYWAAVVNTNVTEMTIKSGFIIISDCFSPCYIFSSHPIGFWAKLLVVQNAIS